MSPDDLARRIGVRASTVQRWESGATQPGAHRLSKLAGILGVSLSWLIVGHGEQPVDPPAGAETDVDDELAHLVSEARDQINEAMSTLERVEQRIADAG